MSLVLERIDAYADPAVWICRLPRDAVLAQARAVEMRREAGEKLPLFGIPFAIKDSIDLAGYPTTAACPAYSYIPERSATVVERLLDAGAIAIGKANLDQFGTGLAGDRSPYGACRNVFNPDYISGGSSSGSGVAVAAGLVSFALGTDTAGSGRVPAAANNVVGLKPAPGLLSTAGMVPCLRVARLHFVRHVDGRGFGLRLFRGSGAGTPSFGRRRTDHIRGSGGIDSRFLRRRRASRNLPAIARAARAERRKTNYGRLRPISRGRLAALWRPVDRRTIGGPRSLHERTARRCIPSRDRSSPEGLSTRRSTSFVRSNDSKRCGKPA